MEWERDADNIWLMEEIGHSGFVYSFEAEL